MPIDLKINNKLKFFIFITFAIILLLLSFSAPQSFCNSELPKKIILDVPFLCQAPYGDWSQPWQDACEEAVIIMAMKYVNNEEIPLRVGNSEILDLVDYQISKYGGHHHLTASQTVKLLKDYYKYGKVKISNDVTIENIKENLAKGNIVIAPMAGQLLGSPCYTPPGPVYHMMLFKGYDDLKGEFITNDAGTRQGEGFRFKYPVAYNAIHDWTGSKETITQGKKIMIIVSK